MDMAALNEFFCQVEQTSVEDEDHLGRDPDGLTIHILVFPTSSQPGKGHTLNGWNVRCEGAPPSPGGGMWQLTKVWEQ